jgi:hypothetical protein
VDWNTLLRTSWLYEMGWWLWFGMAFVVLVAVFVFLSATILRRVWFVAFWLFFLLPGIFIVAVWPDLWVWLIPSWIFALIALIAGTAHRRGVQPRRGLGVLITVIATVMALLGGLFGLGVIPGPTDPEKCVVSQESSTPGMHLYFFDEGKRTGASFGTPVSDTSGGEGTFAELHERRSCDPYLTAAHAEAEGIIPPGTKNQYAARFIASASLWGQTIAQLEEKEAGRITASVVFIPAGSWSWCMSARPDGTIVMYDCTTAEDGFGLLIEFPDGTSVLLRFECGFQPVFETPPGNPNCPPEWGPKCLEPKDRALSYLSNPDGTPYTGNGGELLDLDENEESQELQEDPAGDAEDAEEAADADNAADEEEYVDESEDDVVVEDTTEVITEHVEPPAE